MNKAIAEHDVSIGYQLLLETLFKWGVTHYVGVTGGGGINFLKYLNPLEKLCAEEPSFLTIAEYSAGFIPLGYYLSSGRIAASVATTGAASKLLSCGLSDAKLHDIPAVYIVPHTGEEKQGQSPLQDTSVYGRNIVAQLRCELPESVFVLDSPDTLAERLSYAYIQLKREKPVVLVLLHNALNNPTPTYRPANTFAAVKRPAQSSSLFVFCEEFRHAIDGRRLVLLVGEEMARYPDGSRCTLTLKAARKQPFRNIPSHLAPNNLNHRQYPPPRPGYVDMVALYQQLDHWWPAGSVGFDDVCLCYKDRQYVVQRPNNNIHFYSIYRGSAMGGAFGAVVGAKLALPKQPVFLFTGDGCFRLFSGSLGEVSELGFVIFLVNNASFLIVGQGLPIILPEIEEKNYHANIRPLDYCEIARACGWGAEQLAPDLSNLHVLLDKVSGNTTKSFLIDIPVDPLQVLGQNPRVKNL